MVRVAYVSVSQVVPLGGGALHVMDGFVVVGLDCGLLCCALLLTELFPSGTGNCVTITVCAFTFLCIVSRPVSCVSGYQVVMLWQLFGSSFAVACELFVCDLLGAGASLCLSLLGVWSKFLRVVSFAF